MLLRLCFLVVRCGELFFGHEDSVMNTKPVEVVSHGNKAWANQLMDCLRREECLCLNCDNLKPGQSDSCHIARTFYEVCVKENVALAVTRCPLWKPKIAEVE